VRIALLGVIVIAAAYFMLLRPRMQSSPATGPTPAPTAHAPTTTPPGHSPLPPGVAGLARAVQHARDAAGASQAQSSAAQQANPTAGPSPSSPAASARVTGGAAASARGAKGSPPGAATTPKPSPTASAATAHSTHAATPPSTAPGGPKGATAAGAARVLAGPAAGSTAPAAPSSAAAAPSASVKPGRPPAAAKSAPGASSAVQQVQQELSAGKTVVILFWNPNGSDDRSVRQQLKKIDLQDGNVTTHVATVSQVTDYGTVTSTVNVLQTPTLVIVNPKGQASTLTGLQDYKAIDQAVNDAEQAAGTDQLPQLTAYTSGSPRAAYVRRVNAMCGREIHKAGNLQVTSHTTLNQVLAWITGVNGQILNNVLHLAPPAQDGAYIDAAVAHEREAFRAINRAVADESAHGALTPRARELLLEVQNQDDRAAIMFSTYGLTACVSQ
jgi:hypothetical protein